jgi:hypothetical protein
MAIIRKSLIVVTLPALFALAGCSTTRPSGFATLAGDWMCSYGECRTCVNGGGETTIRIDGLDLPMPKGGSLTECADHVDLEPGGLFDQMDQRRVPL